jgi:hypothetical protein
MTLQYSLYSQINGIIDMSNEITVDEVKEKTMELLGITDPKDVDYITQDLLDSDATTEEDSEDAAVDEPVDEKEGALVKKTIWGHNMRYCRKNGKQYYCYERGADPATSGNACGHNSKKLPWSHWDHVSSSKKCSESGSTKHRLKTKFVKKS